MISLSNDSPTSSCKKVSDANIYQQADYHDAQPNDFNVYKQLLIKNERDYLELIDLQHDTQDEGNLQKNCLDNENIQMTNKSNLVPLDHCKDSVIII